MRTMKGKNKKPNIFLTLRPSPKSHRRVTSGEGKAVWEHHNGMICWTADGCCGCLGVIVSICDCECVCMWLSASSHVYLCEGRRSRGCNRFVLMHSDCGAASHSHDPEFLLDYQRMEIKGEYAAAALITDRSVLHPLNHPDPGYEWLPPQCTLWCCQSGPGWRVRGLVLW